MQTISDEATWINELPLECQLRFLARLSFNLTVAGRNSYEVGTNELTHPSELRRVNEIQHRVTACLSQLLNGDCPDGFVASMANLVLASQDVELNSLLQYSWAEAKNRSIPMAAH